MISAEKRLAFMQQRMIEIVEHSEYSLKEKRLRVMAQLERVLEVVVTSLPQEQRELVQAMLTLYDQLWSCEPRTREDCRIHTRNSTIFLTVTLDQEDETVGTIHLNDQSVRVYLVEDTNGREWATTLNMALYLHARWKGTSSR